jgi:ATP-dependent Clp protease ATP-binding subunit ClpA
VAQRSQHAQRVLHLAREEAERSGHCYLGPEHLVLGVLHDGDSGASRSWKPTALTWQPLGWSCVAWPIGGW